MKNIITFMLTVTVWIVIKIASDLSLVDFINNSFLVGIISLLAGACIVIFRSGFLSIFFQGFRVMNSFIAPRSNAMERAEQLVAEDERWQNFKIKYSSQVAVSALWIGFSSITVSLIGLALY